MVHSVQLTATPYHLNLSSYSQGPALPPAVSHHLYPRYGSITMVCLPTLAVLQVRLALPTLQATPAAQSAILSAVSTSSKVDADNAATQLPGATFKVTSVANPADSWTLTRRRWNCNLQSSLPAPTPSRRDHRSRWLCA